jgi:hypothetical protein
MIHIKEEDAVVILGTGVEGEVVIIRITLSERNQVQKSWHKTSSMKHKPSYRHLFRNISNKSMILHLKRKN